MYVYCVLYANTYYDLIRMFMHFIIIIIYFEIIFFTIFFNLQKLFISSGNRSIDDLEFLPDYFLLRNLS
jgi:dolichyl-phosphate-mannose--protein O-mannosyl transferase